MKLDTSYQAADKSICYITAQAPKIAINSITNAMHHSISIQVVILAQYL